MSLRVFLFQAWLPAQEGPGLRWRRSLSSEERQEDSSTSVGLYHRGPISTVSGEQDQPSGPVTARGDRVPRGRPTAQDPEGQTIWIPFTGARVWGPVPGVAVSVNAAPVTFRKIT